MKKAVMYGAGNIGRGFIGQLFSESGYEVIFIDINADIIDKLNTEGRYPVRILSGESYKDITVSNVKGVNGLNLENVACEIAQADIMATAVGVNVLPRIAKPIAQGLKKRWRQKNFKPMNIIVCENLLDADKVLTELLLQELDPDEKKLFAETIGMVEASIGRMVPVMTHEKQEGNILRVCVEEYCELPVDKDGFKGEIPAIQNMKPFSPFSFYIQRKLFIHNMGHALTAYLGSLKGYEYIWQAIEDVDIRHLTVKAMQDSARALSKEHGVPIESILSHVDDLISRFGNRLLGDKIKRVGNDVKRKLSSEDRLVGAANMCSKHGIDPINICIGIAAAIRFGLENETDELFQKGTPEDILKNISNLDAGNLVFDTALKLFYLIRDIPDVKKIAAYTQSQRVQ